MKYFVLAIFTAFILSGCGGGGGSTPAPDVQTPTPEYHPATYALTEMGARHAHSLNFRGQSVTVFMRDTGVRNTHRDLSPNIFTLTAEVNLWDANQFGPSHGTGAAGLVAGLETGVAPAAKMIFPDAHYSEAARYSVQIIMESRGDNCNPCLPDAAPLSEVMAADWIVSLATRTADGLGDSDIVLVSPNGNNGYNSVQSTLNLPEPMAAYPIIATVLQDNWLMATALNTNTVIAEFANGCGYARMWCISAFGRLHRTTDSGSDTDYTNFYSGTSAAAPHVAGALAVLQSAMPEMKMTEIRLILLETATDLGEEGVDEVYGWGLVNISAGITHLQGIAGQIAAIEEMNIARLGGAAKAAMGNKFAAATGESFRFWGGLETESVYGGLATKEYGGVSAFGEVGNSELRINSFLANGEVQNAESESWTAGIQRGNIWRHNDNLQISARQESRLSDGELVLQYSFGKQIRIPIKQKPTTIWTAAYSQESDNGKWTAAMEWNALTDAKGFSFAAEIDL